MPCCADVVQRALSCRGRCVGHQPPPRFHASGVTEALGRCYTVSPSAGGSQSRPSSASGNKGKGKGKGRADYKVIGKGKGHADPPAEPMDRDGDDDADDGEDAAGDSAGADLPAWGGF